MTLRNDDVIQVSIHGIIVGRAIVVGQNSWWAMRLSLECGNNSIWQNVENNLDTSDVVIRLLAMLGRINAARRGHSWYVRVVNLECTVRRL